MQKTCRILMRSFVRREEIVQYSWHLPWKMCQVHRRDQFGTSSIPIFPISNVTGTRLNLLRSCLNLLPVRNEYDKLKKLPAEFRVSGSFEVEDVGTIVAGTVCSGSIQRDDRLLLGPDSMTGRFEFVRVRSIHNKRVPVDSVSAGQSATMAISSYDENTPIRDACFVRVSCLNPKRNPLLPRNRCRFGNFISSLRNCRTIKYLSMLRRCANRYRSCPCCTLLIV